MLFVSQAHEQTLGKEKRFKRDMQRLFHKRTVGCNCMLYQRTIHSHGLWPKGVLKRETGLSQ